MASLRDLPSVDRLLRLETATSLQSRYGRDLTTDAVRETLDRIRAEHRPGDPVPGPEEILAKSGRTLAAWAHATLLPVVNATGVIIHTNLGRAPLSDAALAAMTAAGQGYSNLEFDLDRGQRGSRYEHAAALVCRLTGAEAALVVNNNAAAVLLALAALASRRRVVISRTQLVEIGGGFRIPDVMKQSGAKLVEIGATNRVHLDDYERALSEQPIRLVLSVHPSNFQIIGFTEEPSRSEIAALAKRFEVPYVEDLGSGTLLDTAQFGLAHEPTVQEVVQSGVDLVTFSGDKLLGGPQAGIIAGERALVERLRRHPLARAVRADKTTYAGLAATLLHYLKGEALNRIPVWRMISASQADLEQRAAAWAERLAGIFGPDQVMTTPGESTVGGGSLPGETLPTSLLSLLPPSAERTLAALRASDPPIIARIRENRVLLDPRTVLPEQESALLGAVEAALSGEIQEKP